MIQDDCIIVLVGLDRKQITDLPPKIIGIRRTSNINELAQIYSGADVFVNPSVEETFGLATVEALACGTPVIVFDSTPGVEIVVDGCGYVAATGNLSEIKKFIDTVGSNGKNSYSEQCIRRVRDNFKINNRFDEYIELYNSAGLNR